MVKLGSCKTCHRDVSPNSHSDICRACRWEQQGKCTPAYVYALKDPRTGLVRYVGATVQTLAKRLSKHMGIVRICIQAAKAHNKPLSDWLRIERNPKDQWLLELATQGLQPDIEILEVIEGVTNPSDCLDDESKWIAKLLRDGMPLTNKVWRRHYSEFVRPIQSVQLRLFDWNQYGSV